MQNNIKCPNCGTMFPVETALFSQAEEEIRKKYENKIAQQAAIFHKQKEELDKEKADFDLKKEKENEIFKERLEKKLEEEKQKIARINQEELQQKLKDFEEEKNRQNKLMQERIEQEKNKIQQNLQDEFVLKLKNLQEENEQRKSENLKLKEKELEILKKEKKLLEEKEELELRFQKEMLEKQEELAQDIRKKEQEKVDLRVREYEKKLEDQKKLIEEMQRKAEQGSMQLQGEVQELALGDLLRDEFKFDQIDDVAKGVRGADLIQTVMNKQGQECGKIIFESKRTKTFTEGWIEKLKEDQRLAGAHIAVIVSSVYPKEMDRFGQKEGVWICSFAEVKSLTFVLREMILREHSAIASQENSGEKMKVLYNYLVSSEFRQRIEAIVEGFTTLKQEMDSEKRAMQRIWKEREKHIEKVIGNTIDMYGSIRGIAGREIQAVQALELGMGEEEGD